MTEQRTLVPLTAAGARALAVLLEKERTVPDSYPMSLNALLNGCNQRSNRDPVMQLDESALLQALEALREQSLVIESSGSRVTRYEHNLPRVLGIPTEAAALLAVLMLRGPQTAAELRAHVERMARFADTSSVPGVPPPPSRVHRDLPRRAAHGERAAGRGPPARRRRRAPGRRTMQVEGTGRPRNGGLLVDPARAPAGDRPGTGDRITRAPAGTTGRSARRR